MTAAPGDQDPAQLLLCEPTAAWLMIGLRDPAMPVTAPLMATSCPPVTPTLSVRALDRATIDVRIPGIRGVAHSAVRAAAGAV